MIVFFAAHLSLLAVCAGLGVVGFRRLARRHASLTFDNVHRHARGWLYSVLCLMGLPVFLLIVRGTPWLAWRVPLWLDYISPWLIWGPILGSLAFLSALAVGIAFESRRADRRRVAGAAKIYVGR